MNTEIKLDVRNLEIPRQIARIRKLVGKLYPGQTLKVSADSSSTEYFETYCEETGNKLIETSKAGATFYYLIKKQYS